MREGWAVALVALLLVPQAAGQTAEIDPVLGARIIPTTTLNMAGLDRLPVAQETSPTECASEGTVEKLTDTRFRFSEEGHEAACAYVFLPVDLPPDTNTMTVQFAANRVLVPTIEQPTVAERFTQDLHVLGPNDTILDQVSIFDESAGQQAAAQDFSFLLRFPGDLTDVRLAWYFEDVQPVANPSGGPSNTPAWRSTVRDPVILFDPFEVPFVSGYQGSIQQQEGDTIITQHRNVVNITLGQAYLQAGTNVLELDVLATQELQSVALPGDRTLSSEDLQATIVGSTATYTLPTDMVDRPGQYSFEFISLSTTPLVQAPLATIFPIAWIGILLPMGVGIGAATHHEVFRRRRMPVQDRDWYRMLITLALLWFAYMVLFLFWLLRGGLDAMGTIPWSSTAILYWAAVAMVTTFFAVHWGIGAMRRHQARRLLHQRQLEERNVLLERSNEELEQFALMAAHDLQEPLRKVISYTTLLQHRYKDRLDNKAGRYIDQANQQADRMRRLIADVLAFSRIGGDMERTDVDLDEVYAELQRGVPDELAETGVQFMGKGLGKAWGNPAMVRQVMENLIANGIKYRREGVTPRIKVTTEERGLDVLVGVQDNGMGIEPEYTDRIFDLFERLHGRDSKYPGTGIGLAICKKIVETHGGRIWVESKPKKGSTFFFTLPHEGLQ